VHLKVADLDRAIGFYRDVMGFELTQRYGAQAAFLSAGGYHHHVGLNTWQSRGGSRPRPEPPASSTWRSSIPTGPRWPGPSPPSSPPAPASTARPTMACPRRSISRDPDGNGIEIYRDRPEAEWPRDATGQLEMINAPLDLEALLAEA
jgi:catechol 2,3-dioxygenase